MNLKRIFCFHTKWKEDYMWHPARRFGAKIYKCERCGKIIACEPWNPPVNYYED